MKYYTVTDTHTHMYGQFLHVFLLSEWRCANRFNRDSFIRRDPATRIPVAIFPCEGMQQNQTA